jgi:hypothetical protein
MEMAHTPELVAAIRVMLGAHEDYLPKRLDKNAATAH